jgi:mannitol-specific phosphotransferase system IIBC component
MNEKQKLISWIMRVTVLVLASVTAAVVSVLMVGIFLPNDQIDNKDILALIGPAFNTVIGAFVGLLGGLSLSDKEQTPPPPPAPTPEPEPEVLSE